MRRYSQITVSLAALALVMSAPFGRAGDVTAQNAPPARFYGALTIDGAPAPAGILVQAFVGDVDCTLPVSIQRGEGQYVVDVQSDANTPGCGFEGASVQFYVNGFTAEPFGTYEIGHFIQLDLFVNTGAALPPAELPAEAPPAEIPPEEVPPADVPPAEVPPEEPPVEGEPGGGVEVIAPPAESPAEEPPAEPPAEDDAGGEEGGEGQGE